MVFSDRCIWGGHMKHMGETMAHHRVSLWMTIFCMIVAAIMCAPTWSAFIGMVILTAGMFAMRTVAHIEGQGMR